MRTSNNFHNSGLVRLKDQDWLDKQRVAGKIVAGALQQLEGYCQAKTFHSMATLNAVIEKYIIDRGATPTFKNYKKVGSRTSQLVFVFLSTSTWCTEFPMIPFWIMEM